MNSGDPTSNVRPLLLPVFLPLALVALILIADFLEGPKTAFVGVIAVIPMLAAALGTPRQTAYIAGVSWLAALAFGFVASDGNATAQRIRLVIIAISGVGAFFTARHREAKQIELLKAERNSAFADQFRRQADTDLLTGTLNRRGVMRSLGIDHPGDVPHDERRGNTAPTTASWTIALIDCDQLKKVNDTYGHGAGDSLLRATALRLTRAVSDTDIVGRWGGDEFLLAICAPHADAVEILSRVHRTINAEPVTTNVGEVTLTATIGAAAWRSHESFEQVLKRADSALYLGKRNGRDSVRIA